MVNKFLEIRDKNADNRIAVVIIYAHGVHLYSEWEQPIYVNSKFLAAHTANGGVQKIRLLRKSIEVRELFSDRVIAKNCKEFEYEFQSPDTALFSY